MTTLQDRPDTTADPRAGEPSWLDPREQLLPHHPADLIVRRPDLYGVSTLADIVADSVLWAV